MSRYIFFIILLVSFISPVIGVAQNSPKDFFDRLNLFKKSKPKKSSTVQIPSPTTTSLEKTETQLRDSTDPKPSPLLLLNEPVFDTLAFIYRNQSLKQSKTKSIGIPLSHTTVYKKEHQLDSSYKVLGWHPHWMKDAYLSYNFSLLSAIAYFSYEINPSTGGYTSIHDWETTTLIDSAHAHSCKVLLSVTNFGEQNNSIFFASKNAQQRLINELIALLLLRNADGVNLDFENVPKRCKQSFTNFIIDLATALKKVNKEYWITLALPAVDFYGLYDVPQLNPYIDLYIIMGYEYYGQNSHQAGPVAPISSGSTWWPFNLERSIDEYCMLGIPKKKLLLGLPYYGAEWQTSSLTFPSRVDKFIRYPMYRTIKNEHGATTCCDDEVSKSKFYVYRNNQNSYTQLWYDNEQSLSHKYELVKQKKLGGIGIWALGYDNGYTELWELLANKFALPSPLKKAIPLLSKSSTKKFSFRFFFSIIKRLMVNPKAFLKQPKAVLSFIGILSGVSLVAVFVLIRYSNQFKRYMKLLLKGGIVFLVVIVVGLLFVLFNFSHWKELLYFIVGFFIASIVLIYLMRPYILERNLP